MQSPQLSQYHRRIAHYQDILGGRCSKCGKTCNLQFDHIDPKDKDFTFTKGVASSYPAEVLLSELEKCQLLCDECHLEKTLDYSGRAEHGTGGMYKKGCRCDPCREVNRQYQRDHAARKRAQL